MHACRQPERISVKHWIAWVHVVLAVRTTCLICRRAHVRVFELCLLRNLLIGSRLHALRLRIELARLLGMPMAKLWRV